MPRALAPLRVLLIVIVIALGCTERERPVARAMELPLAEVSGELGARPIHYGAETRPAGHFTLSLPSSYALRRGGPDDGLSSHTFDGSDTFVPSFTVRRPVGGETETLGHDFGMAPDAVVTRGEANGLSWAMEVRSGSVATRTVVDTLQPTALGSVFCSGYVDTTDDTPVGEWMVARCASLHVN